MKKIFLVILAAVAVISASFSVFAAEDKPAAKVIAYYFHGTARCPTCYRLEQYSKEAIETNFKDALASGNLEFEVINVENKGNERFSNDYQLYTKSLILSLVKDGKETKWKNLGKIWEYAGNKQRFVDYVKNEVTNFLKEVK